MSVIDPTSKLSLRLSCLSACDNDIQRAEELFNYLASGMDSLPDLDPVKPSGLEQIKRGADDILGWIGSHKDEIGQGIALVQSFRKNPSPVSLSDIEPIPQINETS